MRALVQRVKRARVTVDGQEVGAVGLGFLVLLGVTQGDGEAEAEWLAKKVCGLRIFPDEQGKTNLSLKDVDGGLLIVSQFTLYGDCRKGYRPSFDGAAPGERARALYEYFTALCRRENPRVATGVFGAHMEVELVNDGPFTLELEREKQ